jgi:endonuclease/exonuclease/phosphatase (EEP) superfamily protein YafD
VVRRRGRSRLWPWLLIAYLAWAAASWIIAAISNAVMLALTPAVTPATPFVLALILLSALAHDSQQSQPESPPPNRRDAGQHVEVPHGQD